MRETTPTMTRPEEPAGTEAAGFVWRLEYTLLLAVVLLMTGFAIAFFYFSTEIGSLKSWGYAGLFIINLIGAASILLPSPAAASVVGAGAVLDDLLGLPAFIWVGLVAGLAEAIGEFTGYAAGYGGRIVVKDRPQYERVHDWMTRRGTATLFTLSLIPNPLFDIAGVAAGVVRMPIRRFFLTVLAGKTIKNMWLAGAGGLAAAIVVQLV